MKFFFVSVLTFFLCFGHANATSDKGFRIEVKLSNYTNDTLMLGYHLGDKQYVRDTAVRNAQGNFVFEADTLLPCGVYLVIMKPDNQYFQLMLKGSDERFFIETNAKDPYKAVKIKNSVENTLFYDYMGFLGTMRDKATPLSAQMDSTHTPEQREAARKALDQLDKDVKAYQKNLVEKNAGTLTAAVIKASIDVDIPEFTDWKDSTELQTKRYLHYRAHFFDNMPLNDDCMLRTPIIQTKVMSFLEKVVPQHPDTINVEIDTMLNKMGYKSENFQYFVTHLLNYYSKPKYVGFDGVYVHMALTYYKDKTITPWVEDSIRAKIVNNALALEPTLVGKKAPNIRVFKRDSTTINLYDVTAPYTIVLIWSPTCGHCKKSMPDYTTFYEKYKQKGVEIFAVCSVSPSETEQCWDFIDKDGKMTWINTTDPYNTSRYRTLYDVKTTPKVLILDKDKVIRSKQMESDQIQSVIDQIMAEDAKKIKGK